MLACTAETASGDLDWIEDDHVELEDEFGAVSVGGILFLHVRRTSRFPQDAMGSVIGMADGGGASTATIKYDAFGNVTASTGSGAAIPSSVGTDFRYHGMQLDAASGLYHVRARTYDARTGRFTSRDPVSGIRSRPESMHPYVFCNSNPVAWSDPSGAFTLLDISKAAVGWAGMATRALTGAGTAIRFLRLMMVAAGIVKTGLEIWTGVDQINAGEEIDTGSLEVDLGLAAIRALSESGPPADEDDDDGTNFYHYTNVDGHDEIAASRTIRARDGKVWLTKDELNSEDAWHVLFISAPSYEDRGEYVIKIRVKVGVPIYPGPREGLEWIHYGSLREPRHMRILEHGPNPF